MNYPLTFVNSASALLTILLGQRPREVFGEGSTGRLAGGRFGPLVSCGARLFLETVGEPLEPGRQRTKLVRATEVVAHLVGQSSKLIGDATEMLRPGQRILVHASAPHTMPDAERAYG